MEQKTLTEMAVDEGNREWLTGYLTGSDIAMRAFCADATTVTLMLAMGEHTATRLAAGGKLSMCGTGGSAADAHHIAGEFTSRLMHDREPMAALAPAQTPIIQQIHIVAAHAVCAVVERILRPRA